MRTLFEIAALVLLVTGTALLAWRLYPEPTWWVEQAAVASEPSEPGIKLLDSRMLPPPTQQELERAERWLERWARRQWEQELRRFWERERSCDACSYACEPKLIPLHTAGANACL